MSLNSRTVNTAAALSLSTDTLLSRLKIRHGVNSIPVRTLPFIFLYVQLKGCFWQLRSGKKIAFALCFLLALPLSPLPPISHKTTQPSQIPSWKQDKAPTQPPLPFSRNGPLRGSPGSTSRPDRNKQRKQRVSCPSREGLKRVMPFIKMQGRDTSHSQSKASLELARSNRRKATRDRAIVRTQSTSPNRTQGATAHPAYQGPQQGSRPLTSHHPKTPGTPAPRLQQHSAALQKAE